MLTAVGNFFQPLPGLRVHVGQTGERTQRPEVLPHIADGAFHFTFLPGRANVAGTRYEVIFAGKTKEARIEADKIAIVLGDRRGEVVVPDFAACARQELKGMDMAPGEGLEGLAVRKFEKHLAAVAFDQAEGIEFAWRAIVYDDAEVAPIDIAALAWRGFHAHKGPPRH